MSDFKLVKLLNPPSIIVGIIPTGEYDPTKTYTMGMVVSYGKSSYVALQATTGNLPTDTTYWQLLVGPVELLEDLVDVNVTVPAGDGDSLVWNTATSKWINHKINKTDVGLSNVDNTSDINKPVSLAQQAAIDQAEADAFFYALVF